MRYLNPHKKNSTITTLVMCAIVFCLFTISYLYWHHWDLLTYAQHVLSNGQTRYNRFIGVLVITIVLLILQQVVFSIVRLSKYTHALTYFPSMLALAVLCDIQPDLAHGFSLGKWAWLVPLTLLLWGSAVWIARQALPFDNQKVSTGVFSRRAWINLLLMLCMMLFVAFTTRTDAVFHYRTHIESSILLNDYDEALRTGIKSEETDVNLTMLRAFVLSKKGQLAERLFEYPVVGRSEDLLPFASSHSRLLYVPYDSLYSHFGAHPIAVGSVHRYFDLLERDSLATNAVADYRLCGYLIDGRLDTFVEKLPAYYNIEGYLPKHYREALLLYNTKHAEQEPIVFDSYDQRHQWEDFQELRNEYADLSEQKVKIGDRYRNTYWYYYFYTKNFSL